MSLRRRVERGFTAWGRLVVRWRWAAIAACCALTGILVVRLPEIRVDNSEEAFLHADDPERVRYDRFKERFDREDRVLVVLRPPEIFDLGFLTNLRALHLAIEREVPYVAEVTSLVNARNTRGEDDALIVEDLMERWPESDADLAALRARALGNPLYIDVLLTADAAFTTVSVEPFTYSTRGGDGDALAGFDDATGASQRPRYLTEEENNELVEALIGVVERHGPPGVEAFVVGGPTFDYRVMVTLQRDAAVFMSLALAVEILLLALLFRRISGVALPILVVVGSMASTLGLMVWLDIPFSVTLNMLPAFLLVVGACDSVHILTLVYRQLEAGESREQAIAAALGHSGLAVVMTSVTTAVGLVSFVFAGLAPIAQLGVLAPAGVMLAMVYSLTLLPALLAVAPLRARAGRGSIASSGAVDRFLTRAGDLATRHPWRVVAVSAAVMIAAAPGLRHVHFANDGLEWLPDGDPFKRAVQLFDREFKGASSLEVVVDTARENGLYEPEVLRRIERAMRHSETLTVADRPVSKAISIVDVLKETHQALNENRPEYYVLPGERPLVAQELLLFENSGSDDLEDVTDSQFRTARISVRTPWVDSMLYPTFVETLQRDLREILGADLEFELTGGVMLFTRVFRNVILSLARSYAFALLVITPLMVLLIGNLRRGLVAMIPNLIPVYLVLGVMGWTGIPLDASTLLIGGVVIGLAVDDTIHFMHKFSRYFEDSGDARLAVHETLSTTGTALFFTSLVLASGFAVFLASYMRNTLWFGALCLTATVVAFLADVLLGPALMTLVTRKRSSRAGGGGRVGSLASAR